MNAAEHASRAADLLRGVDEITERQTVRGRDEWEHLSATIDGRIKQENMAIDFAIDLAGAHALAAIALSLSTQAIAVEDAAR